MHDHDNGDNPTSHGSHAKSSSASPLPLTERVATAEGPDSVRCEMSSLAGPWLFPAGSPSSGDEKSPVELAVPAPSIGLQQVFGHNAFPSGLALLPMTLLIMIGMMITVAPQSSANA